MITNVDGFKRRSKANPIKRLHNPYFAEIQEDMANEEEEEEDDDEEEEGVLPSHAIN